MTQNTNQGSIYDYVANTIMDMLVEKNPMFELDREERIPKIKMQYEKYLESGLISLLLPRQYEELQEVIINNPNDTQKKNEYLVNNIQNFDQKIQALTKEFIELYSTKIRTM